MYEDLDKKISRRTLLKSTVIAAGVALTSIITGKARAAKASKAAMKYQDKPNGDEHCSKCMFFIPGKKPTANGTCQVVEDSISPHGWCTAFTAKA